MPRYTEDELRRHYEEGQELAEKGEYGEVIPRGWIERLWDTTKKFFELWFLALWNAFTQRVPEFSRIIYDTWNEVTRPASDLVCNQMLAGLSALDFVDEDDMASYRKFKNWPAPFDVAIILILFILLFLGYMKTKAQVSMGTLVQQLNKVHSPSPPSPHEILQAAFVAPERTADVREGLMRAGLSESDIDLMFLGMYRLYNEEVVRTLWLRGVLNDDQMYMRMRELGYTDTRTKEIIQGWPIIPGPSDLFHLVAKEAFEPEMIEKMGLDDEFPVAQVEWLTKQGISEEWARKYWYAHWDQPSIQMGYEMIHRGIIGAEELDMLFRTVEIPPYWRDKLTKIAYNPYTRVDTRRMHDLGVLSDEELVQSYKDQGYDDEKAGKMALFTIRYNQLNQKQLTMAQILKGFNEYLIERKDALDLLVQIDYSEAQAEYLIILEEYNREKDYQDEIVKQLGDRYKNNLIEEFEVRNQLGQLNLPGKQIELLLGKWKLSRFLDVKMPSKTDLDKFLKAKIIKEDTYRMEMTKLGYGFNYVSWYLALVTGKRS